MRAIRIPRQSLLLTLGIASIPPARMATEVVYLIQIKATRRPYVKLFTGYSEEVNQMGFMLKNRSNGASTAAALAHTITRTRYYRV